MYGRKPKYASMKGIRHDVCKVKVDYTTPTKTKREMASPKKSELYHGKITPKTY